MTSKIEIFSQNLTTFDQFEGSFLAILGSKKSFSVLFQNLELFRKCLGIVFNLKRPTFGGIFSSKGR